MPQILSIEQLNDRRKVLIDSGYDIHDPNLNARQAYIQHMIEQNAKLSAALNETDALLQETERINCIILLLLFIATAVGVLHG